MFFFLPFWGVCVGGMCVLGCICITHLSKDLHMTTPPHTEDSTPSEDPNTGPQKTLAKNAENVMFFHLRGVSSAPRTLMDFKNYYIFMKTHKSLEVLVIHGCVCVCVCFCYFVCSFFCLFV